MSMLFNLFHKKTGSSVDLNSPEIPRDTPPETQTDTTEPVQLRTPSPSVDSASVINAASPSTPPVPIPDAQGNRPMSPLRTSLSALAVRSGTASPDSSQVLQRLISSVPSKTFHTYTVTHLRNASPPTIAALTSFYANLQPPPKLHCVRCHKDYMEVDNDERSCLVPHDDESTLVERVGRRSGHDTGATYETLWQCCGRTVEGNGDQGPPDGWCYEGKHTPDVKRARFRADSTPQKDRLVSCIRRNCHNIRATLPRVRPMRHKRTRSLKEPDTEEEEEEEAESSATESKMEVDDNASSHGSVRGRSKRKIPSGSNVIKPARTKSIDTRAAATKTPRTPARRSASANPKSRSVRKSARKTRARDSDKGSDSEPQAGEDKPKKRRKVA